MSDYHARHLGGGLIALYRGDEEVREIGITPGWHFKDRDEFIARYNRDAALQSEKARADAAEALLRESYEFWSHYACLNEPAQDDIADEKNEMLDKMAAIGATHD